MYNEYGTPSFVLSIYIVIFYFCFSFQFSYKYTKEKINSIKFIYVPAHRHTIRLCIIYNFLLKKEKFIYTKNVNYIPFITVTIKKKHGLLFYFRTLH